MDPGHHVTDYAKTKRTCVDDGTLVCTANHALFERMGWKSIMLDELPHWVPPAWVDPEPDDRDATACTTHPNSIPRLKHAFQRNRTFQRGLAASGLRPDRTEQRNSTPALLPSLRSLFLSLTFQHGAGTGWGP